MKRTIFEMIQESMKNLDKYYKKADDLKDGDDIILAWLDEDGYAVPYNAIVKKHDDEIIFANPDDDRDMIQYDDFLHYIDHDGLYMVVFNDVKEAKKVCDKYNK